MNDLLIKFNSLPWENTHLGVEQKEFINGNKKLRLIKFKDNFVELDWCIKGHVGFVLEGEMKIHFNHTIVSYTKGDGLWIENGANNKHKVVIDKGKYVLLILFEEID